jgi:hypothetical protein
MILAPEEIAEAIGRIACGRWPGSNERAAVPAGEGRPG